MGEVDFTLTEINHCSSSCARVSLKDVVLVKSYLWRLGSLCETIKQDGFHRGDRLIEENGLIGGWWSSIEGYNRLFYGFWETIEDEFVREGDGSVAGVIWSFNSFSSLFPVFLLATEQSTFWFFSLSLFSLFLPLLPLSLLLYEVIIT